MKVSQKKFDGEILCLKALKKSQLGKPINGPEWKRFETLIEEKRKYIKKLEVKPCQQ